jgi:4-hydroxybenzoate decarboxylase
MRQLLDDLDRRGELDRVARTVSPRFELAAVARAAQRASERASLFERVTGSALRTASNIYGSHARLCRLIGSADQQFCAPWLALTDKPAALSYPASVPSAAPEPHVESGLAALPQIVYHARDGGPYITSAIYLAREPDSGVPNLSFHRSMVINDTELRVRLGSTHDLTRYQAKAESRGQPLEALLIGVAPEIFLSACASLPYEVSELEVAARIRGAPIAMRPCSTIDLMVPDDTEIVVEGRFLPGVRRPEGPFGEFMGLYVEVGDNHVFEVTRVTHRPDAIFHALICGSTEDLRPLEVATAARIYKHLTNVVPGVLDVCCRPNAMITIIKIRKQYEGHGRHALLAAMGANLDFSKVSFVVDEDVDIYDLDDVMWAYLVRGRADTRAMILNDVPGFYRDPHKDHWGRLAIDATMPWGREREFARKSIPGENDIRLADYLAKPGTDVY